MKLSSFLAVATTALATLFSGVDAQQPVSGFYPVRGPAIYTNGAVVRRLPLQFLASDRPDIYNMFLLALVSIPPCVHPARWVNGRRKEGEKKQHRTRRKISLRTAC